MPTGIEKQNTYRAEILMTGSGSLSDNFQILSKTSFSGLVFTLNGNNLISFNENNGEFSFLQRGFIDIEAIINAQALQASAEFYGLLEIYRGVSWERAPLRKEVLTAIEPSQVMIKGSVYVEKNYKIRFCSKKASGNIDILTEYENGNIIPAGIITFLLHKKL